MNEQKMRGWKKQRKSKKTRKIPSKNRTNVDNFLGINYHSQRKNGLKSKIEIRKFYKENERIYKSKAQEINELCK